MSANSVIRKDEIGLYVAAGGYVARPFWGTCFKEGDRVKSHHFGGSTYAGVGLRDEANFRKEETYEEWCTTGIIISELNDPPEDWKKDAKKNSKSLGWPKSETWKDYIKNCTDWYKGYEDHKGVFAIPRNKTYAINRGIQMIQKGDVVDSIGGFFKNGLVEEVDGDLLTIRWREDTRAGTIDYVQVRSKSIVRLRE
jgi:hypothetical protein